MAHAHDGHDSVSDSDELATHRRGWHFFLTASKWFALHVLGLIFFLIFTLVGHAPFIPTLLLVLVAIYLLGSLFH